MKKPVAISCIISVIALIAALYVGYSTRGYVNEATSAQHTIQMVTTLNAGARSQDDCIPLSAGSFVIVYEQTGDMNLWSFSVEEIMNSGCVFTTDADEWYFLMSEGDYLDIHCFRANRLSADAVGNNIVAVRLDGVPGYSEGIWASRVINYTLGYNGIAASVDNALGPDTQLGPYGDSLCTYLGDQLSSIVLGF